MLRHFQSSPSLPQFPNLASEALLSPQKVAFKNSLRALPPIISPVAPSNPAELLEEEEEQNFDIPLSREEKPEAYPNGPICVHEPYIDLYAEPTVEQCRAYDVIFNVASEVRNPFQAGTEPQPVDQEIRIDGGGGIQYAPKRLLMAEQQINGHAAEDGSPTTPKATPLNTAFPHAMPNAQDPEYIHIPWEHNTDIVPELLRLVKLLDDYVSQGKRVLVHCQCGVSRSASLVVAYGLYKDPNASVQEAYDAVKRRSKWIGPNMNFIMQLQEFRTSLTRGGVLSGNRGLSPATPSSAYSEWHRAFGEESSRPTFGDMSSPIAAHPMLDDKTDAISPGPSSAPSGRPWLSDVPVAPLQAQRAHAVSAIGSGAMQLATSAVVDPAGHVVPVLRVSDGRASDTATAQNRAMSDDVVLSAATLNSPRSTEFNMTALQPRREVSGSDDFDIMSPTSTSFANPFDRNALLASLGMGSVHDAGSSRARAVSLRSQSHPPAPTYPPPPVPHSLSSTLSPRTFPRLRGKISSPSLREQKQLQNLQVQIENQLHLQQRPRTSHSGEMDGALMSPRATEFTKNPFALDPAPLSLTVPEQTSDSQVANADPRSPAQPGASPIVRSIMDVL